MNQRPHHKQLNSAELEVRLRNEKPAFAAPLGFTERVISELPSLADSNLKRNRRSPMSLWPRFVIVLAALTLAAIILTRFQNAPGSVSPKYTSRTIDSSAVRIPNVTPEQLEALAVKLDQPLEKELRNMVSDTRQAIQFVASNFIPEN
jgi:hypothetical protein